MYLKVNIREYTGCRIIHTIINPCNCPPKLQYTCRLLILVEISGRYGFVPFQVFYPPVAAMALRLIAASRALLRELGGLRSRTVEISANSSLFSSVSSSCRQLTGTNFSCLDTSASQLAGVGRGNQIAFTSLIHGSLYPPLFLERCTEGAEQLRCLSQKEHFQAAARGASLLQRPGSSCSEISSRDVCWRGPCTVKPSTSPWTREATRSISMTSLSNALPSTRLRAIHPVVSGAAGSEESFTRASASVGARPGYMLTWSRSVYVEIRDGDVDKAIKR